MKELFKVVWFDDAPFSVALPLKDAQAMFNSAEAMWGEGSFKLVRA